LEQAREKPEKTRFSPKSKVAVPKTEVLEQPHVFFQFPIQAKNTQKKNMRKTSGAMTGPRMLVIAYISFHVFSK
jgi:hypothetical protein